MAFDFEKLKRSLKGLDEVLREIAKMPKAERDKLFENSEKYLQGKVQEHQTVVEQERTKRQRIEAETKQWDDKILIDRTEAEHRFSLEMEQLKRDASVHLETTKTQEEKKRVDYRILKEIEMQAEKTRRKLEATKQFEAIDSSLLSKEKDLLDLKNRLEAQRADTELSHQKQLLSYRLEEEAKVEVKMSDFRLKQAIKERDAFRKDIEQEQRMMEEIRQKTEIEKNRVKWEMISSFFDGDAGRSRAFNLFGLFAGTIVSYYGFKTASPVAAQWISNRMFRPRLLSKCVTKSFVSRLLPSSSPLSSSSKVPKVVMGRDLEERMRRITEGTKNTNLHHGLFGHVLLYGLPGTGKSMFAERLAYESDMSFALMSGSAFDQFEPGQAISEIKNLFLWANRQPNGVLLFVDECDSFLEDRKTLSPERVRVLNEFINQTGTETRKFMLCFETNRPEVLDPAVQSRITQSVEFLPPLYPEILLMLRQYLDLYLFSSSPSPRWMGKRKRGAKREVGEEEEERIAREMEKHRFVGRDVTNYVIAVSQAAYSSATMEVDSEMMRRVLGEQIEKKQREAQYLEHRSLRILDHRQRLLSLHSL